MSRRPSRYAAIVLLLTAAAAPGQAALLGRLPATEGGTDYRAWYDTVLDITWLANPRSAAGNTFGVAGINANGTMNYATTITWLAAMNAATYLGANNWRLPRVAPLDGGAFNVMVSYDGSTDVGYRQTAPGSPYQGSTANEMAHLYYNTLGNTSYCALNPPRPGCVPIRPANAVNVGPFAGWLTNGTAIWTETAFLRPTDTFPQLRFVFGPLSGVTGFENGFDPRVVITTWAVRDGDIAPVPLPAGGWMLLTSIATLAHIARRRKADEEDAATLPAEP